MKNIFLKYWRTVCYEIGLSSAIFITGFLWFKTWDIPIYVMASFTLSRQVIGNPKHFKSIYLCAIWSYVIFIAMFLVATLNVFIAILVSIFFALCLSDKFVLGNNYQWKPKNQSKYQLELDYVKYEQHNQNNKDLIAFEERLNNENDILTYMCYVYIFKQGKSWEETATLLQTETPRLTPIVDKIAFGLRMTCKF